MTTFSIAAIDELWLRGTLAERRLMHGRAEERDGEIVAVDARDEELVGACEWAMLELRAAMPRDARVRLVARCHSERSEEPGMGGSARRPSPQVPRYARDDKTMTIEMGGLSIVTTPEFAAEDAQRLRDLIATKPQRDD
ncbi:MAG TPA: hypothetical protein VEO74_06355, partial [Thermoanaerobaculia bacterium]|nr:hypothetical protein [Thermoanaerobaculia bacterium]